jgi:putative copper resistance protein D
MVWLWICILWSIGPTYAQDTKEQHQPAHDMSTSDHVSHTLSPGGSGAWEGSAEGIAYSEFNHHLAGGLVILMGLAELAQAGRWRSLAWTKRLLPASLIAISLFLLIWSDHDAWPIGQLTFGETFFGHDAEILQHKSFGLLLLIIGVMEFLRRSGYLVHWGWSVPLPLLAGVAGVILFGHTHGAHPSAHQIAIHHAAMGTLAIVAGSSKLLSGWVHPVSVLRPGTWDWIWAGLIVALGFQLLLYSE